ncbi:MAG: hypothetical protein A3E78_06210 [Alphaproteobacteria bacterium RIFCSPHIGHO2_12_FULL_63_12]|nr:MAG: hypothetical protein A3E78_06210 [Alphaproteobacteria bacterium RIFCSPHIGHO2_12_FULL_63_12]
MKRCLLQANGVADRGDRRAGVVNPQPAFVGGKMAFAVDADFVIANTGRFIQSCESKGFLLGYYAEFVFRRTNAPLLFPLQ